MVFSILNLPVQLDSAYTRCTDDIDCFSVTNLENGTSGQVFVGVHIVCAGQGSRDVTQGIVGKIVRCRGVADFAENGGRRAGF